MRRLLVIFALFSLFGIAASAQYVSDWNPDADGDNTIGVNDLLALLSVFEETDSDDDGVYNSQSSEYAADWNPDADGDNSITVTDLLGLLSVFEETDSDNDGIFDSQDDCVGTVDVCGVCNGPGPTILIEGSLVCPVYGCTDNAASNFSATANTDDGTCAYGPAQCGGQSTVTYDGYTYNLVGIGNQCWFKENLRNDNYRNGDAIPGDLDNDQWASATSGSQAVYGNNPSNLATYGRLYNWYAVNDVRGLCPNEFHVPSDEELSNLMIYNEGYEIAGATLKSSPTDIPPWDGTNSSGFSSLPGGLRYNTGNYSYGGTHGFFWSSSIDESDRAWIRILYSGTSYVNRYFQNLSVGVTVRCIRDTLALSVPIHGCTIIGACNYSPLADMNDGSCLIPDYCDFCEGDGIVFGDPDDDGVCAEDEVFGCTDNNATNFNPAATEEDGTCAYGPAQCGGASTVTFDGYTYNLVAIGNQCWFKENLRSDHYRNGDEIPGGLDDTQWSSTTSGATVVYGDGISQVVSGSADYIQNLALYGRLYNWHALNDARDLCPAGYHVPTAEEWVILADFLGPLTGGLTMKSSPTDTPAWNGTNSSGFSGLPGGYRSGVNGYFINEGETGDWWSSSSDGANNAWSRSLSSYSGSIFTGYSSLRDGHSVRCVKD